MTDPDRPLDPPDTGWINKCARCGEEFHSYNLCVPWCEECKPRSIEEDFRRSVTDSTLAAIEDIVFQAQDTMECPNCHEIAYEHVATTYSADTKTLEFNCTQCNEFGFFDEPRKLDSGGPKDDREHTQPVLPQGDSRVVAVVEPKDHWFTKYSRSTEGKL